MATNIFFLMFLGLTAGVFSGLFGIGGGVILVPAMVFILKMSQRQAQGTTLALMVLPIGLLAAWQYYLKGHVDIKVAAFICIGFVIGGLLGAKIALPIPDVTLRRLFGVFLLVVSVKMIVGK